MQISYSKNYTDKLGSCDTVAELQNPQSCFANNIDFCIAETSKLILKRSEMFNEGTSIKIITSWIDAICWLMKDLSAKNYDDFQQTRWKNFSCQADWKNHVMELTSKGNNQKPNLGQSGEFFVNIHGFEIKVNYTPFNFVNHHHMEFRHFRNNQPVNEAMPISETGYKSAYLCDADLSGFNCPKEVAEEYIRQNSKISIPECNQLSLL